MPHSNYRRDGRRRNSRGRQPARESVLNVDGLEVHVARKPIRNMYLRVKPPEGRVEVSVPARLGDGKIREFVRGRADWVELQQKRIRDSLGQLAQFDSVSSRDSSGRRTAGGATAASAGPGIFWTDARKHQAAERINARLPALLAHWGPIVGRSPSHITLRLMTSRWGSCTPATGRIRLNLQLGLMDPRFLEYVLVHEMTHLWENGHGAGFQRRMTQYLPQWRRLRRDINQQVVY